MSKPVKCVVGGGALVGVAALVFLVASMVSNSNRAVTDGAGAASGQTGGPTAVVHRDGPPTAAPIDVEATSTPDTKAGVGRSTDTVAGTPHLRAADLPPSGDNTVAPTPAPATPRPPVSTVRADPNSAQPTAVVTDRPVAENGSRYGDISPATGRPKTVEVKGYTRKDGTYVRGHYRSAPRK